MAMSDIPEKKLLPGIDVGALQREMQDRDTMLWSRIGLKLAAGVPLTLAGPLVMAIVLSLVGWANDWAWNYFTLWFILGCAIWGFLAWKFLPRGHSGSFFADEMTQFVGLTPEESADPTLADIAGQEPKAAAQALTAKLLGGPRRLYEAWQLIQERKAFGDAHRQRAIQLLHELSRQPAAYPWLKLRQENEMLPQLLTILGYLKATDWIGIGSDGNKVWMLSDARKAAMKG